MTMLEGEKRGLEAMPMDQLTGMPLLLAPRDLSQLPPNEIGIHHPWQMNYATRRVHPENMLRGSWTQRVEARFHNGGADEAFHRMVTNETRRPSEVCEQLGAILVAKMGYIPEMVVDTSEGYINVRQQTDEERHHITRPIAVNSPTDLEVEHFRAKWHPGASLEKAKSLLMTYREGSMSDLYADLGSCSAGSMHRTYINEVLLRLGLEQDDGTLAALIGSPSPESDHYLLSFTSELASSKITVNGMNIASLYTLLRDAGKLHPDMPEDFRSFFIQKLSNPIGGVALNASSRELLFEEQEMIAS